MNSKTSDDDPGRNAAPAKDASTATRIVAYHPSSDVGLFRTCPKCRKWFALRLVESVHHKVMGEVRTYRCKRCGHEVTLTDGPPNYCLD
jgi:hypothetical protein